MTRSSIRWGLASCAWLAAAASFAQAHPLLSSGPMLAYSEMTDAAIWVQTTKPAKAQVVFFKKAEPGKKWKSKTLGTTDEGDHIATFHLSGLDTGTEYGYELWLDGKLVKRDYPLEFRTQAHWRWAKNPPEPPSFTFATGSCAYISDSEKFDRPGPAYGGEFDIFKSIHARRPEFMVWLGDNIYYREPDWLTEAGMRYRWRKDRSLAEMQPLLGSTHHYGIWDDHDFGPNDSDSSFRLKEIALEIFKDYWPQVNYGTPETKGLFHRFEWADVEFFMLDNRYHRTPNRWPAGPDKKMFGDAQVRWLKESLMSSNATFKIVCGGNQMTNPMMFFEAFGRFPDEQKDLFDFIAAQRIPGVLFLSGDRHSTELLKVQWPNAPYPWYEYTSSPLTSGSGRNEAEANNPARVPGTWVTRTRNFGLVQVSGPWRDRKLTLTAHDKDGKELWKHDIKETELRAPRG